MGRRPIRGGKGGSLRRRQRLKRWVYRAGAVLAVLGAVAWLCFQHIPQWYQPLWLSSDEVEEVRAEAEQTFQSITRQMAAGEPFSVALTVRQINEMLSAQQIIWPAAIGKLDPRLSCPWIGLESNELRVGMRCRWGEVQSILSLRVAVGLADERLMVRVVSVGAGSLPVPGRLVARHLLGEAERSSAVPSSTAQSAPTASAEWMQPLKSLLTKGECTAETEVLWWPSGEIPFRIGELDIDRDRIAVRVVPLVKRLRPHPRARGNPKSR